MATIRADTLERGLRDLAVRAGTTLGERFVGEAQANASRRTGRMADETRAEAAQVSGDTVVVHVECGVDYGRYQDEGTGIYGPTGQPIRPRRPGGVLVFDSYAAGGLVFARSVRGSEPTRWWSKTVAAWAQIVRRVSVGG